ncbi:MAG TPA: Fur family transcriptional regulator [Acetivibrio sp.]|nr:Fur family transcriptional regulator [Acetivibrio sp.]
MNLSTEEVKVYLLKHNIKPSYHRVAILKHLLSEKNHPSVDKIYNELVKEMPTLSKTTVYNTLNLFSGVSIVRVITIEENETRYDGDVSDHGHFKCEKCKTIYDFQIKSVDFETDDLSSFKINEKSVYYKGICPKCLDNKK